MKNKLLRIPFALVFSVLQSFLSALPASASFSEAGVEFPLLRTGSAAWGDYDNDSFLDLVVTGITNAVPYVSEIWHNNGNNTFSNIQAKLTPHSQGPVAWADLNNDGFLDLILAGRTNSSAGNYTTEIWSNIGGTNFVRIPGNLSAGSFGSFAVGDFDNDGRPDILFNAVESGPTSTVFRNLGSFGFRPVGMPTVENPASGFIQMADTDNDGWLDVFLAGDTNAVSTVASIAKLYRNLNGVALTNTLTLPGAGNARGAFADYNHDGRLDLLVAATIGESTNAHVWFNNGMTFLESGAVFPFASPGGGFASASWGDFNNDGFSDIFLLWKNQLARIFQNNNDGTFTDVNAAFPIPNFTTSLQVGEAGDYNNDGKLDLLVSVTSAQFPGYLYRLCIMSLRPRSHDSIVMFLRDEFKHLNRLNLTTRFRS